MATLPDNFNRPKTPALYKPYKPANVNRPKTPALKKPDLYKYLQEKKKSLQNIQISPSPKNFSQLKLFRPNSGSSY